MLMDILLKTHQPGRGRENWGGWKMMRERREEEKAGDAGEGKMSLQTGKKSKKAEGETMQFSHLGTEIEAAEKSQKKTIEKYEIKGNLVSIQGL